MTTADTAGFVFFDVDGTLVPGTSSSVFLAGFLGHQRALMVAEDAYAAGQLTNQQVSVTDAEGWTGHGEEQVRGWLVDLPLVDGIAETVAWCREQALAPVLATLAWDPVGRHIAERFGFRAFCGAELEVSSGRYTGRVRRDFDEYDKRDFALRQAREGGVDPTRCAAVGDSRSDLPLFAAAGLSIAFNATPAARAAASTAVDGDDLRTVIPALRAWQARN
ncbi:HAD family hydrolase [Streptacidiphilus sp. PAMC 29251]